jgi:hypothetical protein
MVNEYLLNVGGTLQLNILCFCQYEEDASKYNLFRIKLEEDKQEERKEREVGQDMSN